MANVGNLTLVGPAIRSDFFALTGTAIPKKVKLVFTSPGSQITVKPTLVRPHWVVRTSLPSNIPLGQQVVQLVSGSTPVSAPLQINVTADAKPDSRALHDPAGVQAPYTIAILANPAIKAKNRQTFRPDPLMTDRPRFQAGVGIVLRALLTIKEDLLRQFETQIRFVTLFAPSANPVNKNALVADADIAEEDFLEPRLDKLVPYLDQQSVSADVVFLLSGEDGAHAVGRPTNDDLAQTTGLEYDGVRRPQGHGTAVPGCVVLPLNIIEEEFDPTVLHEFCHAAASADQGRVIDLYNDEEDGSGELFINKRWRKKGAAGDIPAIPGGFVTALGTDFRSDKKRNGVGYDTTWTSYHPETKEKKRLSLMDDYTFPGNGTKCRLDKLTSAWLTERLRAKLNR